MKRSLGSSDSLGALMSICPTTEENSPRNAHVYSREFQSMLDGLDEEGCVEESGGQIAEKKRRLSVEQVKALEKNFEVENKLEPERKVKLAQELGLQPRQVAVWFQNRRARWKTKQLERDYGVLKANFENLKHNYDTLQRDNETLLKEIRELKAKLNEENSESNLSVKEEIIIPESDNKVIKESDTTVAATITASESKDLSYDAFNTTTNIGATGGISIFPADNFKDGSSDSDSSAILNEDNSPNAAISSSGIFQNHGGDHLIMSPAAASSSFRFNSSSSSSPPSSMNCFHLSDTKAVLSNTQKAYSQTQFVKLEEHNFFSGEEAAACTFFSDEQAPSLHWYCPDQWS